MGNGAPVHTKSYAVAMVGYPPVMVKECLEYLRLSNPQNPFRFTPQDLQEVLRKMFSMHVSKVEYAIREINTAEDARSSFPGQGHSQPRVHRPRHRKRPLALFQRLDGHTQRRDFCADSRASDPPRSSVGSAGQAEHRRSSEGAPAAPKWRPYRQLRYSQGLRAHHPPKRPDDSEPVSDDSDPVIDLVLKKHAQDLQKMREAKKKPDTF